MPHSTVMSMTAFASRRGQGEGALAGHGWVWDIRSVNGKGLDLRLRLPDWVDGLEVLVRAEVGRRFQRGNIALGLKLSRDSGAEAPRVSPGGLAAALSALAEVQRAAEAAGLALAPPRPTEVMALRGVMDSTAAETDSAPLLAALLADLGPLLDDFAAMRAAEGAALAAVIGAQLDQVADLAARAREAAEARRERAAEALRDNLARILHAVDTDPARVAQELALMAVKADVTEELDRLDAHVVAARALLAAGGPVGRKFDFLTQEFNREANTLCAKAQSAPLTAIGLDLKHVIDQMREQVQNLE